MRMDRRAGLLYAGNKLPTLAEIFSHVQSNIRAQAGQTTTAAKIYLNLNSLSGFTAGNTAFSFLFAGGSFDIARIDRIDSTTISLTTLDTAYVEEFGAVRMTPAPTSSNYTRIGSDIDCFGVAFAIIFDDTYPVDAITEVLRNANKECLKYYYSVTPSRESPSYVVAQTGYKVADLTPQAGYVFAAFPENASSNAYPCFSLSACATPLERIISYADNAARTYPVLATVTYNSNTYLGPSIDGSNTAGTRSYSLFRLEDVA